VLSVINGTIYLLMLLVAFKEQFVDGLLANIDANLPRYAEPSAWAHLAGQASERDLHTLIELLNPDQTLLPDPEGTKSLDGENAIRLHKALYTLTPVQARDPRLWARLSHVEFWPYMTARWPVHRSAQSQERGRNRVRERYFVAQSDSRAVMRHGLSRLWWGAKLSHDESRLNPYELTALLFSEQDLFQQTMERSLGRSPSVLKGFLQFLIHNKEHIFEGKRPSREIIRPLLMSLNARGGRCVLDCLSPSQLTEHLDRELKRIASS